MSQTKLGEMYCVSRNVIGIRLKAGVMGTCSAPTDLAIRSGYCIEGEQPTPYVHFWLWHKEKVIALFEQQGHKRVDLSEL